MRHSFRLPITVGIIIILAIVVFVALNKDKNPSEDGTLLLTNIPELACPTNVRVVAQSVTNDPKVTVLFDRSVAIIDCRKIALSSLLTPSQLPVKLFVKLPNSLAQKILVDSLLTNYTLLIRTGDLNDDNLINNIDEELILSKIVNPSSLPEKNFDLNSDQITNVLDVSTVRLNSGVGVAHPSAIDGKWESSDE